MHRSPACFKQSRAAVTTVTATVGYLKKQQERPFNYATEPPAGTPWENYERDERPVSIIDVRHREVRPLLHEEGFSLWDAHSQVCDFHDSDEVVRCYYPEVAELACVATGATRAYVFDHMLRTGVSQRAPLGFGRSASARPPAANGQVHNDYTEESGRRRVTLVLGESVSQGFSSRYSIVNVWRSIRGPVLDTPLAVCDSRTIDISDLVSAQVHYPDRTGEIYLGLYSSHHRWYYFSSMDRPEALVFKQFDSRISGVSRLTLHSAFQHPDAPADAPPRESVEARCLVVYE